MFLPAKVYSRTAAWNLLPSHSSHVDSTVVITPSSVKMTPAPLQAGQAPSEFALNSVGFTPFALANALRIGSSNPVYVAGLLRREPRIGALATATTPFRPETEPLIRELFPDPATPVTTTSTPSGMSTSTSWRLWVFAPWTSRAPEELRTE